MTSLSSNKKTQKMKFKKAPGAPKRFKSAYMFFSENMHKVIRQTVLENKKMRAAEVAKMVSQTWKNLSDEERLPWLEMGRKDRERYETEKAAYKGPWKVPDVKDPRAPKKPQSAFLAFSNERRRQMAQANPHMTGTEISSVLAQLWKECPEEIKQCYRDREAREREHYKRDRAAWEQKVEQNMQMSSASSSTSSSPATVPDMEAQEQQPQAPQFIGSLYTALEHELASFKPTQHVVSSNTHPAKVDLTLEKMPSAIDRPLKDVVMRYPTSTTSPLKFMQLPNTIATEEKVNMSSQDTAWPLDGTMEDPLDALLQNDDFFGDIVQPRSNVPCGDDFLSKLAMVTEPLPLMTSRASFMA